ncbi:MAG: ATP-binding protein [Deltaproteobacteria bacterium]
MAVAYDENLPLYGSRGIAIYLKLLRQKYGRVNIDELLRYAGMEPYQVTDESYLFSQKQINRFYEKAVDLSGNKNLAREAGRSASSPEALGAMKGSILGLLGPHRYYDLLGKLLGPHRYYELLGKLANRSTKSSHYEARRLGPNKVEIIVTPYPGTIEQPYQCENRMGYWEAVSSVFSLQPPQILHPKCLFRGDDTCHYIVSWKQSKANLLRKIRNITAAVLGLLGIAALFVFPVTVFAVLLPVSVTIVLVQSWFAGSLDMKALHKTIENMRGVSDELLEQIEINYQNSQLVNEIGQALAKRADVEGLFTEVTRILKMRLDFDRGMILLPDSNKSNLVVHASYGYPAAQGEILGGFSASLDEPESAGLFAATFRGKKAVLIDDIEKDDMDVATSSRDFFGKLGTRSLVCCPIVYEEDALGVLLVENSGRKRALLQRDINLISGIASQIAARMYNLTLELQLRQHKKMEAIGILAGGLAHDFNNILTSINGYSRMILRRLPQDHELRGMVDNIFVAGAKAAELTRQLLAFSRKQVMKMTVTNLNDIVINLAKMLEWLIGEDITMSIVTTERIGNIRADEGQLEQVLMNLVINARDAMRKGGRLIIETEVVYLDDHYARAHQEVAPGAYAMLMVTDTGYGMSPEVQQEIFEPFFTTKEKGKGTGLGLSTVYGIVKQHHGHIFVHSEEGAGTTFRVLFPVVYEPLDRKEPRQTAVIPHGSETVLVVDDESSIRKFVLDVLEPLGYRVLEASCSDEALALLKVTGEPIDLLLTDVIMPGKNGRELSELVKQARPDIKIVFMSGYTDNAIAQHGVLERGITLINKPLLPETLANTLRTVLNGAEVYDGVGIDDQPQTT